MKKVMFALCFMFGGIVVVTAQDTQDTTSNQYRTETQSQYPQDNQGMQGQDNQAMQNQDQQERERIQTTELPDEVKRTLEGQEYRGWLISGAFKAKAGQESSQMNGQNNTTTSPDNTNRQESANATGTEDEEIYIVELKNGAETKTVRFDQSGQQIEGMDDSQGTQNSQFSQDQETSPSDQPGQSSNRYNQTPESGQTDPSSTTDPAEQSQSEQSTETRTDQSANPDQSTDTETETQSSQSTQTDQSRANEPK